VSEFGEKLKTRTTQFALRVIKMTNALPRNPAGKVLGHQVLRSATSIGANYREAYRARSSAEFLSKMGDCLKESEETGYWLELIAAARLLSAAKLSALQKESGELTALFVTIIKSKRSGL
jgi:four helix bundle protein